MQIYLRYDIEKQLRDFSESNKMTITSVVTKALQQYMKSPGESKTTNREVKNIATDKTCEIESLANLVKCDKPAMYAYTLPDGATPDGKTNLMLCQQHYNEIQGGPGF